MYAGCLAYADDITLVAPSAGGLQKMLQVCEEFGFEYGVEYNSGKTECILFNKTRNAALGTEHCVYLNNCKLKWKTSVRYLGMHISNNLDDSEDIMLKRSKFYTSVNNVLATFQKVPCNIINNLFHAYCTSFYGSQAWNLQNAWIDKLCTAYNKSLCRVWKLPYSTHRYILYKLCNRPPLKEQLIWRFLKMFKNMYYSDNVLTAFVASRSLFDLSCTIGNNCGYIMHKYSINRSEMCDMAVKGPTEFKVNDATDNTLNVQNECIFHTINELKTLSLSIFDNDDVSDLIDVLAVQ